jgi:hypothetical protein
MSNRQPQTINVTFNPATSTISVDKNPVVVAPDTIGVLTFQLHGPATFDSTKGIQWNGPGKPEPVDGSKGMQWSIVDDNSTPHQPPFPYTIHVQANLDGSGHYFDPEIENQPTGTPEPKPHHR